MESFIKKIFDNNIDELVHLQFEKYGRGEYRNKAVIIAKKKKEGYSISTTSEFGGDLVRSMAEKLGNSKTNVTGVIISTRDLSGEIEFEDKKQFMGVKQYVINSEMSGTQIIGLCDKLSRAFFGLSFETADSELKIKPKAPKSAKPSTSTAEKIKADFCRLKTSDRKLAESLVFGVGDFKSIQIVHTFVINEIILPEGVDDPLKLREMAKRKGKIIRDITIDGRAMKEEMDFIA